MSEALHFDAHAARASSDGAHCRLQARGSQIRGLLLRDLLHLSARQSAYLVGIWRCTALFDLGRLADQHRSRRGLDDERETLVRVGCDYHGQRQSRFDALGLGIERLAELHDVQTTLAERGPDRRARIGLARRNLQLYETDNFLGHVNSSREWVLAHVFSRHAPRLKSVNGEWLIANRKICPSFRPYHFHFPFTISNSRLFDLAEIQFHRRGAPEDRYRHPQLVLVVIDFLDRTVEVGKGAFLHSHCLAHFEQDFGLWLFHTFLDLMQDCLHFLFTDRGRATPGRTADKTRYLCRVLHQVPRLVGHFHLDQYIAREEFALAYVLLPALHLNHFFDRNQNLAELVFHSGAGNALDQCTLNAFLEARIGVHHIPFLRHHAPGPIKNFTPQTRSASTIQRNMAITSTKASTMPVVCTVSFRDGQTTFLLSTKDYWAKTKNTRPGAVVHATSAAATRPANTEATRNISALSLSK